MAQVINEYPGIGALLGSGLGKGLGSGLENLAQLKSQKLLRNHQINESIPGLVALGIPQSEASQIARLPDKLQALVINNYLQGSESAGLNQALSGLSGEGAINEPQLEEQLMKEAYGKQVQKAPESELMKSGNSLAEVLKNPRLSPEHRLKVAALKQQRDIAKERLTASEQKEINAETKAPYDEIRKDAKAAQDSDIRLGRMEVLNERNDLPFSLWASTLESVSKGVFGFGIDLSSLLSADAQEFKKLSADFVKDAKPIFGARLTDTDLKSFMQTVPTLNQSKAGRERLIRNMRIFNKAKIIKKKAAEDIIRENGGRRPRDLESKIDDRIAGRLESLANDFKSGGSNPRDKTLAQQAAESFTPQNKSQVGPFSAL